MLKKGCGTCKHFRSYCEEYEDELEDEDVGRCKLKVEEQVNWEFKCKNWVNKYD